MEEEAMFLFIVFFYTLDKNDGRPTLEVKRAALQKNIDAYPYDKFKRINVDFDPLHKEICFVVNILVDDVKGYPSYPRFAAICETQKEAEEVKASLAKGGYKEFLEQKDKFIGEIQIHPCIITNE